MATGSFAWPCRARRHACLTVRRPEPGSTPEVNVLSVDKTPATQPRHGSPVYEAIWVGADRASIRSQKRLKCHHGTAHLGMTGWLWMLAGAVAPSQGDYLAACKLSLQLARMFSFAD